MRNAGASGDIARPLSQEDPPEEGMATQSNILAWRNPWTKEPGATVYRVATNQTQLKRLSMRAYIKKRKELKSIIIAFTLGI